MRNYTPTQFADYVEGMARFDRHQPLDDCDTAEMEAGWQAALDAACEADIIAMQEQRAEEEWIRRGC